jgi:hypothetical protein
MTRRTALLLLFALVALPGTGCYHLRNCVARFRANHGCLFPFYSPYYNGGCGPCYDGCATCFSAPPAAAMAGQPYPGAVFGLPQPLPNTDTKTNVPSPMK